MYMQFCGHQLKMLVDLGRDTLERIVKDGIKEMMAKIVGSTRGVKKHKHWFIALKTAIKEYQEKIKEDFLPVLVDDFSRKMVVKFSGGKMSVEDKHKIKMFMEMVKKSDLNAVVEELEKKVDDLKDGENLEFDEKIENIKRAVLDGHKWILRRLELHVRSVIGDAMYKETVERSKIEVMLYNFVDGDVPDSVKKLFDNGMDSVPNLRMSKKEVDSRVEDALLQYLVRLGKRRICGNAVMQASGVQDWIKKVKLLNIDEESRNFVDTLENSIPSLQAELDLVYRKIDLDSKEEMVEKLEKDGCVLVMCDKKMGMSLFSLDTMRKADEALKDQ